MRQSKRRIISSGGFTLIELLLTILVLGIVVLGLSAMYYQMQMTQVESMHYDLAVNAARTAIEELRNSGYNSLNPSSPPAFPTNLLAGLPANSSGSVSVTQPMAGLKEVNVTVTYTDYGQPQTVILSSDIGIIGISQS
jgi:prepilin-type N-terminal cleavage/methylation domain-containing protein